MADTKAADQPQALGGTAIKPVGWDRSGLEAFKYMLYNPDTGEVLTRTPISWAKIIAFYLVYYSFLAAFWIAALYVFFQTLPEVQNGPSFKLDYSLIGKNPGVGIRPRNSDERIDSQMFVLKIDETSEVPSQKQGEGDTNADYATRLRNFLETYETDASEPNYNSFPKSLLGETCSTYPYGYVKKNTTDKDNKDLSLKPCIIIKLNTIWGWVPEAVGSDYVDKENGVEIPAELKDYIDDRESKGGDLDMVWVHCEGRYAADQEALTGLEYFPERGFPAKYFPYEGRGQYDPETQTWELNYHAPLVAIRFEVNEKNLGQLVHIQCKAYYNGVKHVTKDKQGMVQFEVQVKTNV